MSKRYSIRNTGFISMSDALAGFAKENNLAPKLEAARVIDLFKSHLPVSVRPYVLSIDFSNGIIRAKVTSAPLRNDLQVAADSLCDMINEKLEATIVRKIMFS